MALGRPNRRKPDPLDAFTGAAKVIESKSAEPNVEEMTPEQKKCEEEYCHDFEWSAPEHDVGFAGYGECKLCGWTVPYVEDDFDDNYF